MKDVPNIFDKDNFINPDSENIGEFAVWNKSKRFGNPLEDIVIQIKNSRFDSEKGKRFYGADVINFVKTAGIPLYPIKTEIVSDIPEDELMFGGGYISMFKDK